MATTPEGLPYPSGTDKVVDGDDAIHALAVGAGTTFMLPVALNAAQYPRATVMVAELAVNFDANGRIYLDTSGTFSQILYATVQATTYPFMCACVNRSLANLQFY
jgi:hypothetical protein